jgi:AAA15 family ATPase/GTPase
MLLEFSVNNFLSIRDTIKFSMQATKKDNDKKYFVENKKYRILTNAVIYGANASGKSNFLKAFAYFKSIVVNEAKIIQSTDILNHTPFKLSNNTENSSGWFEAVFFINNKKYRYGFELDNKTVYSEWLFEDSKGKEAKLFYRDVDDIDYVNPQKFQEGITFFNDKKKSINIADNQLFLWVCDRQKNSPIVKSIMQYFYNNINKLDGTKHTSYRGYTEDLLVENIEIRNRVINLMKIADIGIENIEVEKKELDIPINELPNDIRNIIPQDVIEKAKRAVVGTIKTKMEHKKFDINNQECGSEWFDLDNESTGTEKFFSILAPILDTLDHGKVLIIDELDNSLHPLLTRKILELFHDKNINKNNAQLIFATHDTNLLKNYIFRRDQIWFAEKDQYGATEIYSLAQFKDVDKKVDFEKQYIQGKYGAIPYIGNFKL